MARRNRHDRRRWADEAVELVSKLEAAADTAKATREALPWRDDDRYEVRLTERETNYRHAATLARNLLDVPVEANPEEPTP